MKSGKWQEGGVERPRTERQRGLRPGQTEQFLATDEAQRGLRPGNPLNAGCYVVMIVHEETLSDFALSRPFSVGCVQRSGDQGPHCRPLDPASLSLCSVLRDSRVRVSMPNKKSAAPAVIVLSCHKHTIPPRSHAMRSFLQRHESEIKGALSGLDRIRFRGTLRWLANLRGMESFMSKTSMLYKEFTDWAKERTERIRNATLKLAVNADRPVQHLQSSWTSKEQTALEIAARDGVTEGLICVLSAVEPCQTFEVGPSREKKLLELRSKPGKCKHYYFYLLDRQMGLMHLRLQTWAPFTIQVCLNGREWLARQMAAKQIDFEQRDNCFVEISDVRRAQALLDRQLRTNWPALLDRLVKRVHPAHATLFNDLQLDYYWSAEETEWATDVMFRSPEALSRLYPRLVRHALTTFRSGDVLRFLGQSPKVRYCRKAEITSSLGTRAEGTRIKHSRNRNSLKMYDKQQTVLRVETTINNPRDLKVLRPKEGDPKGRKQWLRMRKGVADLHRRAEVSQKSNERYLEALASVDQSVTLGETVRPLCQRMRWKGQSVRGLQPLEAGDGALLAAIGRGEFLINGFRNRDLRELLFTAKRSLPAETKRQAAKVTRLIRLLRAHGLIQKVHKTHRYQLTARGLATVTALTSAQQATIEALTKLAA